MAILKLRTTQQQQQKGKTFNISRPGNLPIKEKISLPLSQSEELYDEKNPDVVPSNEGNINFYLIKIKKNSTAIYYSLWYFIYKY